MEVASITISLGGAQLSHLPITQEIQTDFSTPQLRRDFMQHTLNSLGQIKDMSDATLTKIIEANKQEATMLQKGSDPNKRLKVEEQVQQQQQVSVVAEDSKMND